VSGDGTTTGWKYWLVCMGEKDNCRMLDDDIPRSGIIVIAERKAARVAMFILVVGATFHTGILFFKGTV